MRIRILSSAVGDLHAGRLFYEEQAEGVGAYFFDSLFSDIDSLALYAGIHPRVCGYHRMLSKRFPYAVYYAVEGNTAIVWRVLDLRQDPDRIRRALRNRRTTP
jgi:plasmid stabilization system protein ParE